MDRAADLLPRFLERVDDLPRSAPSVVGVSGGIDSVVLLDLLRRAGFANLVVAHFHHGLRGRAADRDAEFVRRLAAAGGEKFVLGRGQTRARAERHAESLEEAGRRLRRSFFARVAKKHGATVVFLGHHAGDAAETLLFHLARGGGTRGLSSLRERAPLDDSGVVLARPMLGFTRAEIEGHAQAHSLGFRRDASNASRTHTRNRLRHDVLPVLARAVGFDPVPALARAAEILAAEDEALEEWAGAHAGATLETRRLRRQPIALQRRWLRSWLQAQTGAAMDFQTVERARRLAQATTPPAKMNLPRGLHLRRRAGRLIIERGTLCRK